MPKWARRKLVRVSMHKPPGDSLIYSYPENMHPIIVIPSSPTSLITMYNVKKFLEEATYVPMHSLAYLRISRFTPRFEPSDVAKARMIREGNLKAEDVIVIIRRRAETEQSVKFIVVDSVEALSKFAMGGGGDVW